MRVFLLVFWEGMENWSIPGSTPSNAPAALETTHSSLLIPSWETNAEKRRPAGWKIVPCRA